MCVNVSTPCTANKYQQGVLLCTDTICAVPPNNFYRFWFHLASPPPPPPPRQTNPAVNAQLSSQEFAQWGTNVNRSQGRNVYINTMPEKEGYGGDRIRYLMVEGRNG